LLKTALMLEPKLSETVVAAFFAVYRALGFGFLESVYANAMAVELARRGVRVRREVPIEVVYEGVVVGVFRCDMLADDKIMIENKASKVLSTADQRQVLNYLRSTRIEIAYLLHFGPQPHFRRWILTNDRKPFYRS
jgi:GxxExxY protein